MAGDRVVVIELALRPDGSVAETTDTFLRGAVIGGSDDEEQSWVEVREEGGRRLVEVPAELAVLLRQQR